MQGIAGQYKIGKGAGSDFSTISEATGALECGGVAGPVTFTIEKGNYNEHVVISSIQGSSEFNTVTFTSVSTDNGDVTINNPSGDATVVLNGASFVTFKNVSISRQSATAGNCVRIEGSSNYVNFKSVAFYGVEGANTGTDYTVVYFTNNAPKTGASFTGCEISNGSRGIDKEGNSKQNDSKTTIAGTLFFNQYETALSLSNEDAPFIGSNIINSSSAYPSFRAISLDNISNNLVVRNNTISLASGSTGVAMNNCMAGQTKMGHISDNMITIKGRNEAYGISLTGATDNQTLSFNKVLLTGNGTHTRNQAYCKDATSGSKIDLLGNFGGGLNTSDFIIKAEQNTVVTDRLLAQK